MPVFRDELHFATGQAITANATSIPATAVPSNYKRYIYHLRVINRHAGTNNLAIMHQVAGAATITKDVLPFTTFNEEYVYPDELKTDSLPVWQFNASADCSFQTSDGTCFLSMRFAEGP